MPPVPSLRGERIVRALERAGFEVVRIHGSHYILRHPDGRGTTVPVHQGRDVSKGTLRGILADIGMAVEDFQVSGMTALAPHSVPHDRYAGWAPLKRQ